MDRGDIGLRLLLAGMGLGMALMTFVVTFDSTSFYQNTIAPTATEAMRPLGYVLDAAAILSFAMSLGGIACFSPVASVAPGSVPATRITAADRLTEMRRKKQDRARKAQASRASHGST